MQDNNAKEVKVDYFSLRQIIYDCQTIAGLVPYIKSDYFMAMGINPYLNLAAYDVLEMLFKDIKSQIPYSHNIEDVRMKLKFFEDGYSRSIRMIENIDYLQNEIFKNMVKIPFLRDLNIHYNITILTKCYPVLNNNSIGYYQLSFSQHLLKW